MADPKTSDGEEVLQFVLKWLDKPDTDHDGKPIRWVAIPDHWPRDNVIWAAMAVTDEMLTCMDEQELISLISKRISEYLRTTLRETCCEGRTRA